MTEIILSEKPLIRLIHGDCMEFMAGCEAKQFDICITDPPYGISLDYNTYDDSVNNTTDFIHRFMPQVLSVSKRTILTTGVKLMYEYPKPNWVGSWFCPSGAGVSAFGFCCWQPLLIYGTDLNSKSGSLPDSFSWIGEKDKDASFHPVPKPLKLWKKIFNRWVSQSDKSMFDPFLGSGTSAIVAYDMGLDFTGVELDKDYFDAAVKRVKRFISEPKIQFPSADEAKQSELF